MEVEYSNVEEKYTSSSVNEFIAHYQEEMRHNIAEITRCIEQLRNDQQDCSSLEEIKKFGLAIHDLAMVYGYDGVEVIGERIVRAIEEEKNHDEIENLLARLEDATKAIEEAMLLIDEKKERELIRELDIKSGEPEMEEKTDSESETETKAEEEPVFDIREDEQLISLLSDADGKAVEIDQTENNKGKEDESEDLDIMSILGDVSEEVKIDIPESSSREQDVQNEIDEEDILEIDFKEDESDSDKEDRGMLKKISQFLGIKGKNRISFQE